MRKPDSKAVLVTLSAFLAWSLAAPSQAGPPGGGPWPTVPPTANQTPHNKPVYIPGLSVPATIVCQPQDVCVLAGSIATFSVTVVPVRINHEPVPDPYRFQWERKLPQDREYRPIPDETNPAALVIRRAQVEDVGFYRLKVESIPRRLDEERLKSGGIEVRESVRDPAAAYSTAAALLVYKTNSPLTVYGPPVFSPGSGMPCCPGVSFTYQGYVNYVVTPPDWGFIPIVDTSYSRGAYVATTGTATRVNYIGYNSDTQCGSIWVPVYGNPPPVTGLPLSPSYRFTVYFPNAVPTNAFPLILYNFSVP